MTKKTLNKFGGKLNESVGSSVSDFARRQMEKYGWKEGQGLGRNENGMSKHISTKKREDNAGLGTDTMKAVVADDDWWHHGFTDALRKVPGVNKKSKKKKKSKEKEKRLEKAAPSFEELFKATGGKRLGMRARGSQKGKLARTMDDISVVDTGAVEKKTKKRKSRKEDDSSPSKSDNEMMRSKKKKNKEKE